MQFGLISKLSKSDKAKQCKNNNGKMNKAHPY